MFIYYDFQHGCDPKTQQPCHIFYCKQTQFGNKRFFLVVWQADREIAKSRAKCCLELLAFFYSDNYYQELGNDAFHISQISQLLDRWGDRDIINAMTILRLNGLLKYVPLIPSRDRTLHQGSFESPGAPIKDPSSAVTA
jgi:hypothetical protein